MAQQPGRPDLARTTETMMAELVHHMAELAKHQNETNRLLRDMIEKLPR